jgi:hypothetical protein
MVRIYEKTSRVICSSLVPQEQLAKGTSSSHWLHRRHEPPMLAEAAFAQHPGVKRRGKPPHLHRTQVQVSTVQATLRSALSRVLSGIPVGRVAGEPRTMTITLKAYSHDVQRSTFDAFPHAVQHSTLLPYSIDLHKIESRQPPPAHQWT